MARAFLFLCGYCGKRFESVSLPHGRTRCPDCGTVDAKRLEELEEPGKAQRPWSEDWDS